jgi:hypothetical protein
LVGGGFEVLPVTTTIAVEKEWTGLDLNSDLLELDKVGFEDSRKTKN